MSAKGQHVVPRDGAWAVRKTGSNRVTKTFGTQKEAITEARRLAREQRTELYIHSVDGRIRERETYGTDLYPPKG